MENYFDLVNAESFHDGRQQLKSAVSYARNIFMKRNKADRKFAKSLRKRTQTLLQKARWNVIHTLRRFWFVGKFFSVSCCRKSVRENAEKEISKAEKFRFDVQQWNTEYKINEETKNKETVLTFKEPIQCPEGASYH